MVECFLTVTTTMKYATFRYNTFEVENELNSPPDNKTLCISLFYEHSSRANDMDTIKYTTFCYNMTELKNKLNSHPP